jgi:hypothetical protein
MNMPKLQPLPIKTKNHNIFIRIFIWIMTIRKWQLIEDWLYDLPDGATIIIPKGFVFDGASIPRPLWGLLSPTGLLLIPGLIHDFAYRYDYLWALKVANNGDTDNCVYKYKHNSGQRHWDTMFREVGVRINGMVIIDALAWAALFLMGWSAWRSNRKGNAAELKPDSMNVCP